MSALVVLIIVGLAVVAAAQAYQLRELRRTVAAHQRTLGANKATLDIHEEHFRLISEQVVRLTARS